MANIQITVNKYSPNTGKVDYLDDHLNDCLLLNGSSVMVWGALDSFMRMEGIEIIEAGNSSFNKITRSDSSVLYTYHRHGKDILIEIIDSE